MLKRIMNRLNGSERIRHLLERRLDGLQVQMAKLEAVSLSAPEAILRSNLELHRARLREQFGHIDVATKKRVAYDSPDHLQPWGTMRDNHSNLAFNKRLSAWILPHQLTVLDLGCSGGGQVRSFVEQGCLAIGIEGSDYSMKHLRAEWGTIPELLFTADITVPFRVTAGGRPLSFSVITLWEVIEHIHRRDLAVLFDNITRHLRPNGVVIMSISTVQDTIEGIDLHQTVEQRPWWETKLDELGFQNHPDIVKWFGNDFVRSEENAAGSFHVVLTRKGEAPQYQERIVRYMGRPTIEEGQS